MSKVTRGSAWIIVLAVAVVSATAFVARRMDMPAPTRAAAVPDAPAASDSREVRAPTEAKAIVAPSSRDADAIPFASRIYPATPLPPPAAPAPSPTLQRGPVVASRAPSVPAAGGGFFSQPLAVGTPVSTVLDRLEAAADSGDSEAACRVGLELMHCATGAPLVTATSSGPVVTQTQCAGVSPVERQSASRYLAQAAAAGNDAARRALAGDATVSPAQCGR